MRAWIVVGVSLLVGCATIPAHIEIEGRIALRGVEVQRGMQVILEAADAANRADVLEDDALRTIANLGVRVGSEGARLSQVLLQIDEARDPVAQALGIGRAQIIVQNIQSLMVTFPEVPAGVQTAVAALNAVLALLATELSV